jgi:hypothetical protein
LKRSLYENLDNTYPRDNYIHFKDEFPKNAKLKDLSKIERDLILARALNPVSRYQVVGTLVHKGGKKRSSSSSSSSSSKSSKKSKKGKKEKKKKD